MPIVSNMSIMQNDSIITKTVSRLPAGNFISWNAARNEPPLFASIEKKFLKFSQNFQVTPAFLPAMMPKSTIWKAMPARVAMSMPRITEPFTL